MVRPKKNLGQHFLTDQGIAKDIVNLFTGFGAPELLVEIGPGTGVLTQHLLEPKPWKFIAADVDQESIDYLKLHYPLHQEKLQLLDFLKFEPKDLNVNRFAVIGNFPYNISSLIFFKILEMQNATVTEVVCMLQMEVAKRIASGPGTKDYGILSVLLQSKYKITYEFTVEPHVFNPPPKVRSGVIRLELIEGKVFPCKFSNFQKLVKQAFNMRRKTLRNALKPFGIPDSLKESFWMEKRAEQLGVAEFEELTVIYEEAGMLKK